jgi:hypothetical protein
METPTDKMNREAIEAMFADMALVKRATARKYVRKRWALRQLVRAGVFTPEQARAAMCPLVNLLTKWRLLRRELRSHVSVEQSGV